MSFPPPTPTPLTRLHVYDGLMMNAKRWQMMESYHRRRQNLQFQALHQPGIVSGLGVRVVEPPESVEARFKNERWLEIQPGIAIDQEGNPIVVAPAASTGTQEDSSLKFRVHSTPPPGRTITVYIVVGYAEPTAPPQHTSEVIREWFRFDQLTHPPTGHQVELCRIQLQNPVALQHPQDVLFPGLNELDFRYRQQAQVRPQATVRVAQLKPNKDFDEASDLATYTLYQNSAENLAELMRAMAVLYPSLQGDVNIPSVSLQDHFDDWDLLQIPDGKVLTQFSPPELKLLEKYLQQGGGILIETAPDHTEQDLTEIKQRVHTIASNGQSIALSSWEGLSRYHPLRRSPFLFGTLPEIQSRALQLHTCGGVVLLTGRLSTAWGLAEMQLPRADIRTNQELGINILHFLWQRQHILHLLQPDTLTESGSA